MHTADPTCGKDFEVGMLASQHRACHGGTTIVCIDGEIGKISWPHFNSTRLGGESFQFRVAQANVEVTVQESDRGRCGAFLSNGPFHVLSQLQVLWTRQAVSKDCRLKRDDRQ